MTATTPNARTRAFQQVDVFASGPLTGNPVAVVLDADDLADHQMAALARWTNLSETTFVLRPDDPAADYRLRIFTPRGELPFAGHPTLGSAHAWLDRGGRPAGDHVVQQCGVGLVSIRRDGDRVAFAAPPLRRSGPVDHDTLATVSSALGLAPSDIVASHWVDNGPGWLGLMLTSGERVLAVRPDFAALGDFEVGLIGAYRERSATGEVGRTDDESSGEDPDRPDYEVRAFAPGDGVPEDPVTGSLNAGFAMWLRAAQEVPATYVVAQGTAVGRAGRVYVQDDGTDIWIGGLCVSRVVGEVTL